MDGEVYCNNRKEVFETKPSAEEISFMTDADLVKVKDFSIGNRYGRIMFEGETDLTGVEFDKVVTISRGWAEVYPELGCKPPVGTKLNKPARIELYSVFSKDWDSHFGVYLEEILRRQGAEFLGYNSQNGFWAFRVEHFTKYGLDDASNSEESEEEDMEVPPKDEFEEKIKKEAEGFSCSAMENLEVPHPDSIEATVGDDVLEPMAIPEGRSGQFKIEEEEDQVMKRKKYEILPEEDKEIEMPLFHFGTEKEDMKFQAHECDTIYLNVHPSFQEIKKVEVLGPPPALAQSFRVAWSPNGTFTTLSGISQERGTNMLSLYSVREEKKCNNRDDYLKIAYDSMMRIIFDESEDKDISMLSRKSSKIILQGFTLSKEAIPVIWKKMVEELCASVDNESDSEEINAEIEVWALANLLFGNPCVDLSTYLHSHKFIEYTPRKKFLSSIELLVMRKNLLSNWLRYFSDFPEQRSILDCLRSGSPERASILAYQAEKPKFHLAHLINSLGMAGERQRKYLIEQIKTWESSKNINSDILEIYKILH